jgi:hypothetical protein
VRIGPAFRRPAKGAAPDGGDTVAFADAYPFLLTSEASLADLNGRLGSGAVPMSRFRPNLVVSGCLPYEEDTWKRLRIGGIPFRGAGPCSRCAITTTDQETGERGVHEAKSGVLRVGDPVKPLQK